MLVYLTLELNNMIDLLDHTLLILQLLQRSHHKELEHPSVDYWKCCLLVGLEAEAIDVELDGWEFLDVLLVDCLRSLVFLDIGKHDLVLPNLAPKLPQCVSSYQLPNRSFHLRDLLIE